MRPYKIKVEKSIMAEPTELKHKYGVGYCLKLQAVFYGSKDPSSSLHFMDAGGDEFMFPVPGQGEPKVVAIESPVAVRLPISYVDVQGQNEIIVWGEVFPIEQKEVSF